MTWHNLKNGKQVATPQWFVAALWCGPFRLRPTRTDFVQVSLNES
jgi:hypothetical protein